MPNPKSILFLQTFSRISLHGIAFCLGIACGNGCGKSDSPTDSGTSPNSTPITSHYGVFVETQDGGATWSEVDTLRFAQSLKSAAFGFAANVFIITGQDTTGKGSIWRSVDYGFTWAKVLTTQASSVEDIDNTLASGQFVAVASDGSIYLSVNDGLTWQLRTTASNPLHGVDFFNGPIGTNGNWGVAVGNAGAVLVSTDGGSTWTARTLSVTDDFYDVACMNSGNQLNTSDTIVCVGTNGVYAYSRDAGFTWNRNNTPNPEHFKAVDFSEDPSGRYGVAGGNNGAIYRTTDHGFSWQKRSMPYQGNTESLISTTSGKCIALMYAGNVSPIGTFVCRSSDRGVNWTAGAHVYKCYLNYLIFRDFKNGGYGFAVGDPG